MANLKVVVFLLTIAALLFYLFYRVIISLARKSVKPIAQNRFIHGEADAKKAAASIEIKDWFKWNVMVNYEKGTAGGNVKINFPIKSSLLLGCLCILIAIVIASVSFLAYLVPVIFLMFAAYHFVRWYKAFTELANLKHAEEQKQIGEQEHVPIGRVSKPLIAGVCSRLAAKSSIPVIVIRWFFIAGAIYFGLGAVGYLLLWWYFSKKLSQSMKLAPHPCFIFNRRG